MQYRGLFRCGWSEVDVRHKCRGLKRAVFGRMSQHIAGGRKGRKRLAVQAAEPRRGVREEVDVRLCGSGSPQSTTAKRGHFVGHHGEGVLRCKPPNLRALWNCPQKLNNMANDASRYRHKFARMVRPPSLPPSKNPAVWLGSCLVGGGGFERR